MRGVQFDQDTLDSVVVRMVENEAAAQMLKRVDPNRMILMAKLRAEGHSFKAIGNRVGLSTERTRQLLIRYAQVLRKFTVGPVTIGEPVQFKFIGEMLHRIANDRCVNRRSRRLLHYRSLGFPVARIVERIGWSPIDEKNAHVTISRIRAMEAREIDEACREAGVNSVLGMAIWDEFCQQRNKRARNRVSYYAACEWEGAS